MTKFLTGVVASLILAGLPVSLQAGGVTVITHGFNGNVDDWVIPMAEGMTGYPDFPGSTASCYVLKVTNSSGPASVQWVGGVTPDLSDSGEIFIKLDWSAEAGILGGSSSGEVAQVAVTALMDPTLISETGGRPLVELPLHLIGHSRGASVVTEMARLFGEQGVWVDHVTTLDPIPLVSWPFYDADVRNWENVLYADNFWQDIGASDGLKGDPLSGAFNRELLNLSGGNSSSHSDVHLWYHGMIDLATPTSDELATITTAERVAWWLPAENEGANVGYRFSRIGNGDRLSEFRPAGTGTDRIRDGFNGVWDLGGDVVSNRVPLVSNSGLWPNVIRCSRTEGAGVPAGGSFDLALHYQTGADTVGQVSLTVLLDPDRNPWNGNEFAVDGGRFAATGTMAVGQALVTVDVVGIPPGMYAVAAELDDGTRKRFMYVADGVNITLPLSQPEIDRSTVRMELGKLTFSVLGVVGQEIEVRASGDLKNWSTVASVIMPASAWEFTDESTASFTKRFYKVREQP